MEFCKGWQLLNSHCKTRLVLSWDFDLLYQVDVPYVDGPHCIQHSKFVRQDIVISFKLIC